MLKLKTLTGTAVSVVMALAYISGQASLAQAQEASPASRQFSARTGQMVLEARTHIVAEQHEAALSKLSQALALTNITPYERAMIHQMQGSSYYQLGQFKLAIAAYEQSVNTGGLNAEEVAETRPKIAQLMIAAGRHAQGAEALENYLNMGGREKPEYTELLTQAWIQAKEYSRALPWGKKWFAAANPKERRHFDLMNFLYNNLGQSAEQADIVRQMINRWPEDRDLWNAWASLFVSAGQDEDAFAVSKLLYLGGALKTQEEILKVVQYYSYYDMPYQAAQILEKEMNADRVKRDSDKLVQLATLFRQAREYGRAIPVLEAATQSGGTDTLYAQLGEALYNEGLCIRAETAFKKAINLGYEAGKAWTLIATCRYEEVQKQQRLSCQMSEAEKAAAAKTKARQSTIAAFENVPSHSKQARDAKKWISFIKAERLTFDKRCEFEERVRRDECFKDIRRAYDGQFVDGKFTLGNPECESYIPVYDKEYRGKEAG